MSTLEEEKVVQIPLRVPHELLAKVSMVAHASTAGNLTALTVEFYEELVAEHAAHSGPVFRPQCVDLSGRNGVLTGEGAPKKTRKAESTGIPVTLALKKDITAASAAAGATLSRATRQFYQEVVNEYEKENGILPVWDKDNVPTGGELGEGEAPKVFIAVGIELKRQALQAARARGADLAKLTRNYWEQLAERHEQTHGKPDEARLTAPLLRANTFVDTWEYMGAGAQVTYGVHVPIPLKQRIEIVVEVSGECVPALTRRFWANLVRGYAQMGGPVAALSQEQWQRPRQNAKKRQEAVAQS